MQKKGAVPERDSPFFVPNNFLKTQLGAHLLGQAVFVDQDGNGFVPNKSIGCVHVAAFVGIFTIAPAVLDGVEYRTGLVLHHARDLHPVVVLGFVVVVRQLTVLLGDGSAFVGRRKNRLLFVRSQVGPI
ncbi:MAG: hypothetical protein RLZZ114_79, partial [Bacteroidota bacterium]